MHKKVKRRRIKTALNKGYLVARVPKGTLTMDHLDPFMVYPKTSSIVMGRKKPYPIFKSPEGTRNIYLPYFKGRDLVHKIIDMRPKPDSRGIKWTGSFRKGQEIAVERVLNELEQHQGCFLNAEAGTGKTVMALALACELDMWPVYITVDSIKLQQQWAERIHEFVPKAKIGFVGPPANQRWVLKKIGIDPPVGLSPMNTEADFVIVSIQSMRNKKVNLRAGLLICDEAHIMSSKEFLRTIYKIQHYKSLGLSATTKRKDGAEWVFNSFLSGGRSVIAKAPTAPGRAIIVKLNMNYGKGWDKKYHKFKCTHLDAYNTEAICEACDHHTNRSGDCAHKKKLRYKTPKVDWGGMAASLALDPKWQEVTLQWIWKLFKEGKHMLVFSTNVAPLEALKSNLLNRGFRDEDIGSFYGTPKNKAERVLAEEGPKKRVTLATYSKCAKAADFPWKDCLITLSPASVSNLHQIEGRIKRIRYGKKEALIVNLCSVENKMFEQQIKGYMRYYESKNYKIEEVIVNARKKGEAPNSNRSGD